MCVQHDRGFRFTTEQLPDSLMRAVVEGHEASRGRVYGVPVSACDRLPGFPPARLSELRPRELSEPQSSEAETETPRPSPRGMRKRGEG